MKKYISLALSPEDNSHDTSQSGDADSERGAATFKMEYAPVQ
jgi:hypothetical protein